MFNFSSNFLTCNLTIIIINKKGAACRLLTSDMDPLLIVSGETHEIVKQKLVQHQQTIKANQNKNKPFGLVIDGPR